MAITNLNKSNAVNYQLIFPMLPVEHFYGESKEFSLNIFGTVIPSVTLDQGENHWQGGKSFVDSGELTFGDWNLDFVIDSNFTNWKVIFTWLMAINNNEDKYGFVRDGKTIDASLYIMTNYRDKALVLRFIDIWPTTLGEITLSKRDDDGDLVSNVTFLYDKYEIIDKKI